MFQRLKNLICFPASFFETSLGISNSELPCLQLESLEQRVMLSATISIDYSLDTNDFFSDQVRRDALEDVAAEINGFLDDSLDAIVPTGGNSWQQRFFHPGTGADTFYGTNPTVNADEIVVYAGGRNLGGSLGRGGPGGYSASGNSTWFNAIQTRGETGVGNDTDFGPWGGSLTFSTTTNWYFGSAESGLGFSQYDFRSVAFHEFFHVLGVGTADSWDAQIAAGQFTGTATVAEYDGVGNVPLQPNGAHFAEGTAEGGLEVAMDPTLSNGTRKSPTALDWAALTDIGWEVQQPVIGSVVVVGNELRVDGTSDDNLIEVRQAGSKLRIVIDGYDHGLFNSPFSRLVVSALDGNDEIRLQTAVSAVAVLYGGEGNDIIRGGAGDDFLFGGAGNDHLYGRDGNDDLRGEGGNDRLFGMNGDDTLDGSSGDDNLNGGADNDTINGGTGIDTIFGAAGNDRIFADEDADLVYAGTGNDLVLGGDGDDRIFGQGGEDDLRGGDGVNTIDGGAGNDTLTGGNGIDNLFGSGGNDLIEGGAGNDMLYGQAGQDTVRGQGGNDFLYGGAGVDIIFGGIGNDRINGDGGNDQLYGEAGDDIVMGGVGFDLIRGGDGNDDLDGEGGNDDIFGEAGNDRITGGFGLDFFDGGSGIDTAVDTGELGEIDIEIT